MPRALRVVVVYEDFAAGKRAQAACAQVQQLVGTGLPTIDASWKFDVLRMPKLRLMAADDAAGANLVVIATHETASLPACVETWIDLWLRRRSGQPQCLLALLGPTPLEREAGIPLERELAGIATRAGLNFWSLPEEAPVAEADFSGLADFLLRTGLVNTEAAKTASDV
ncbi:MAG: hypothetical protein HYY24_17515 [Verrucomicrobia bacterium]|nr:hypothetical protein [Verrucomicrobiota bacterium]